jgi:hypothetical protein
MKCTLRQLISGWIHIFDGGVTMKKWILCLLFLGFLLIPLQGMATAYSPPQDPWSSSVVPGSIPEGGSDWFFDLGETPYRNQSESD